MIGIKGIKNYVSKPQKGRSGELMSVGASKPLYIRAEASKNLHIRPEAPKHIGVLHALGLHALGKTQLTASDF